MTDLVSILRYIGRTIPALRRLHDSRNALVAERDALSARLDEVAAALAEEQATRHAAASPFFVYNTAFDATAVIRRHAVPDLVPRPGLVTNFLGVLIDPVVHPPILAAMAGTLDPVPIPANWHADIAEWAAALRAVELSQGRFTIIELGCGWGCWMNNCGVAARRAGRAVHLIGVEGDPGHIGVARMELALNGFTPEQATLHHGIAAAAAGTALFPRDGADCLTYGLEPVFGATEAQREAAIAAGTHDALPMVPLADIAAPHDRIDLLHIDIQGGEADLVAACVTVLREKIAYVLIGTHSRQIEGQVMATMLAAGFTLEIERPAILALTPDGPVVTVDGVQGWRNQHFDAAP